MKAISLFSGVGGIELGFNQLGIETIWANEIDKNASHTYSLNHKNTLIVSDISKIQSDEIPNSDLLFAGFPCQPFSIAGHQKGFEDERGNMFFQLARVIRDKEPKIIFIENVKNLISHNKGNTYKTIKTTLEGYGYYLYPMLLNASEYGNIPQNRERIYIVGFRKEKDFKNFKPPAPIPLKNNVSNIINYKEEVEEIYYYTEANCYFYNELKKKVNNKDTLYQWRRIYVRENKSNLCPTLTANMGTGGHNVPIVLTKYGIRKITPKECFLFQGFSYDFKLPKIANSQLYKQAGNSVVVPVISRIAEEIKKILD